MSLFLNVVHGAIQEKAASPEEEKTRFGAGY